MAVTPSGSGKCPVCGKSGSLRKCNKCGEIRCHACYVKAYGSAYANKPCLACGKK